MIYTRVVSKFPELWGIIGRSFRTTAVRKESCHLAHSPNAKLNKSIIDRYMCLPMPECKVMVAYVWIDGTGEFLRCKTRTLDYIPQSHKECPTWTYDGSSTYQATGPTSDLFICPVALYNDPIRRGHNKIVLCETYTEDHKPTKTNLRAQCVEAVNCILDHEPWFGFEQEYQLMDSDQRPFGWPIMRGEPAPAGPYYCSLGADRSFGREITEAFYRACLYAGVEFYGDNSEVTLAQWEFQVGTGVGVSVADDLWIARYLLVRIAEEYGVTISFYPKVLTNWSGSGCHTNFSTKDSRAEGGLKVLEKAICKLEKKHMNHIKMYDPKGGADNAKRLSGMYETAAIDTFKYGVGMRYASIRIPQMVADEGKGYLEDRRPASNCDPYAVMYMLVKTVLIED